MFAATRIGLLVVLTVLCLSWVTSAHADDPYLGSAQNCPGADTRSASVKAQVKTMSCLVNYVRKKAHLVHLKTNSKLSQAAVLKNRLIYKCQQFSHTPCSIKFTDPYAKVGYINKNFSWAVGENIAWGTGALGTPRSIMNAWFHSPEHRKNLLEKGWREQGIALKVGTFKGYKQVAMWSSEFGSRHT